MYSFIGMALVGGFFGWIILIATVAMAQGKKSRTQITLKSETDLLPQIEQWCQLYGYKRIQDLNGARVYQRGSGFWQAIAKVAVKQQGSEWTLEGFLFVTSFVTHAEVAFDETGFIVKLPRENRKKEFNELLQKLGQPQLA